MKEMESYLEMVREARRELEHERECLAEKAGQLNGFMQLMDDMNDLLSENKRMQQDVESLQRQLAEERQQRLDMETKMNEMSKLSAGVAKKASQDDLLKALRIYLNVSKRKMIGKREAAKTVITEMLTSAKLNLPDDIMELLDHLDDAQPEQKNVTVNGNYNDIHDNGSVNLDNTK